MKEQFKETEITKEFQEVMNIYRQKPEGKGLLEACAGNVILFAENMLGVVPYTWQIDFLSRIQRAIDGDYFTKEFLALTSRQIGKSTSVAILSLWAIVFNKYPGTVHNHTAVGIISASDVQAKKLLYEIKKFIRVGDAFMNRTYIDDDGKPLFGKEFFTSLLAENEPNNTTTITMKAYMKDVHGEFVLKDSMSGSIIKSYPPTSAVLGETFTMVIEDEAGKSDKITDQFHYDFAAPTGDACDAIRVYTSTPWTPSGFFYRLADPENNFKEHPADRVLYTIDAIEHDAPKQHEIVLKKIRQMNMDGKTDEVQRAYYCRFVKGELNYFNPEKVLEAFKDDEAEVYSFKGVCDMGIDFGGQVSSKTVITISYLDSTNVIHRLYRKSYPVGGDLSLLSDVANLLKDFNVQRIIPDDCPAGDFLIRQMREKGWNVEPMNFRSDKVKKYGAFRSMLNKGQVVSFKDDELQTEMLALENSQSSRQSVIRAPSGYSDDLIDSFVMSAYFMIQEDDTVKTFDWDEDLSDNIFDKVKQIRERNNSGYEGINNGI